MRRHTLPRPSNSLGSPTPSRSRRLLATALAGATLAGVGAVTAPAVAGEIGPDERVSEEVVVYAPPSTLDDYWDAYFFWMEASWWKSPAEIVPITPPRELPAPGAPGGGGGGDPLPPECLPLLDDLMDLVDDLSDLNEAIDAGQHAVIRNGELDTVPDGHNLAGYYDKKGAWQQQRLSDRIDAAYEAFDDCRNGN